MLNLRNIFVYSINLFVATVHLFTFLMLLWYINKKYRASIVNQIMTIELSHSIETIWECSVIILGNIICKKMNFHSIEPPQLFEQKHKKDLSLVKGWPVTLC